MKLKEITFINDQAKYVTPSWDKLDKLTLKVAKLVQKSGINFDLIVALAKGAWPMSRSFFDYTGIKELASLGVKFYNGINQRLKEPEIYQQIPTTIKGKNILIFDDVADTGESLSFTQNYLLANGAIQVKTATLFIKPWSTFMPDFYGTDTDAWIIFPCEKREMAQLLKKNWCKHGVGEENVLVRLKKLGLWRF